MSARFLCSLLYTTRFTASYGLYVDASASLLHHFHRLFCELLLLFFVDCRIRSRWHLSLRCLSAACNMGSECVVYEGTSFSTAITSPSSKTLVLLGNGLYDTEVHFLQIKFYSLGAYAEPEIAQHLAKWKGKSEDELIAEDSGFCESFCKAPGEKLVKVVIFKEIKGSQFVTPLQSSVRDRLAYADKYEDEEEEALDELVEFFQKKSWLVQGSSIFLHWIGSTLQVSVCSEVDAVLPQTCEYTVKNENIVNGALEWLVNPNSFCPSLLKSVASGVLRISQ